MTDELCEENIRDERALTKQDKIVKVIFAAD